MGYIPVAGCERLEDDNNPSASSPSALPEPPSPCVGGGYMSTVQRIHDNAEEGEMRFLHEFIAFADD